jgi:hypothetical protein
MNDHRDPRGAKLLAGAFHDDWAGGPTAEFARAAAAHARRRRTVRRTLATAGATAVLAVAGFVALQRAPVPALPAPPVAKPPAYEVISDTQLLAALKDSPVLLVKKPDGTREITMLEAPEEIPAPTRSE